MRAATFDEVDRVLNVEPALKASMAPEIEIREAVAEDIPVLRELIELSVRVLQARDYTPSQLQKALATVYGVDTQLIADRTYYVAQVNAEDVQRQKAAGQGARQLIVGCGGWSKRKTLYGGDRWTKRDDDLLDPHRDAAKIRAFFVHPDWTRRGIGSRILQVCEQAAIAGGFSSLEMGATLTGVPLYKAHGYVELQKVDVPLPEGEALPIMVMRKTLRS
jgi:GNAT superfamily N-acetyltransferase